MVVLPSLENNIKSMWASSVGASCYSKVSLPHLRTNCRVFAWDGCTLVIKCIAVYPEAIGGFNKIDPVKERNKINVLNIHSKQKEIYKVNV